MKAPWRRSPNNSVIVEAGDSSLRVGRESQRAIRRAVVWLLVKYVAPVALTAGAAFAAWRC